MCMICKIWCFAIPKVVVIFLHEFILKFYWQSSIFYQLQSSGKSKIHNYW